MIIWLVAMSEDIAGYIMLDLLRCYEQSRSHGMRSALDGSVSHGALSACWSLLTDVLENSKLFAASDPKRYLYTSLGDGRSDQ